jgi:hypothetical protein
MLMNLLRYVYFILSILLVLRRSFLYQNRLYEAPKRESKAGFIAVRDFVLIIHRVRELGKASQPRIRPKAH